MSGHQGGPNKKVARAPLPCERCGEDFLRTSGTQKTCAKCKPVVDAERKAEWRRQQAAANRPPLGELEFRHPVGPDEHQQAKRALGLDNLDDLLALGQSNDPFYIGTDRHLRLAEWFAGLWERGGFTTAHLRRVHYQILSTGVRRCDGQPYENTETCWSELGSAAKYARYLGLVDAELIADQRNDAAVVNCPPREWQPDPEVTLGAGWREHLAIPELELPDVAAALELPQPFAVGYSYQHADRAALVEVWIEKSTMNDVLVPLCAGLGINLVVGSGHESVTAVIALLRRVQRHGHPVHILYVSDFDPAGDSMPKAVARQAQFWAQWLGVGERVSVEPVALTPVQVDGFALPTVPIKATDRRAGNFKDKYGVGGAVELDALEALRPGELARIVRAAAAPWLDRTLPGRLDRAEAVADQAVADQWDDTDLQGELDQISEQAARILDRYQAAVANLNAELEPLRDRARTLADQVSERFDATEFELPDRPEPADPDVDRDGLLYDSARSWLVQLKFWQRHRDGGSGVNDP